MGRPAVGRESPAALLRLLQLTLEQAYISGNTVIVFNGRRELLQSILLDDAKSLSSLVIDEASGHIAVADANTVYLYQPVGRDYGDLRWTRTCALLHETEESIRYLSWGSEDELLVAGDRLTLWSLADDKKPRVIWASHLASPATIASFSPDASLIASCGQYDRFVKIWRRLSYEQGSTRFDVSYLPHPSTVTNLSWRSFWHRGQNLDNLLYTFCADNQVRVWIHSEHHAKHVMQRLVHIDTNRSIQPRRLSVGSLSKNRFVFMLESRDLARAAERSLHASRNGTDHALEHFIQIANRSPEICVILDGLGHMSAWGIENAGLRNKQEAEKFNVALVDGVDIRLPSQRSLDDHVQIYAFANNDVSASLCILVHSYSGQIDWYQDSFVEFFNTATRAQRTRHVSCWSGHGFALEGMAPAQDNRSFISLDGQEHAILWSVTAAGSLVRRSRMQSDADILDVLLLGDPKLAVFLHEDHLSVWDVRRASARKIGACKLAQSEPLSLHQLRLSKPSTHEFEIGVLYEDTVIEIYGISSSTSEDLRTNGHHRVVQRTRITQKLNTGKDDALVFCSTSPLTEIKGEVVSLSDTGILKVFSVQPSGLTTILKPAASLTTSIFASDIVASLNGETHAFAHVDYRTVSIWNSNQGTFEFVRTFHDLDVMQEMYWHVTQNGQLLLAIQFPYDVVILGQCPYVLEGENPAWEVIQTIHTRTRTTHAISSMCWSRPCQVVVGAGSQIMSFDVLAKTQAAGSSTNGLHVGDENGNTHQSLLLQNAVLPIFDPSLLGYMLECGDYSIASNIFHALHNELKFLIQGEKIEHNLSHSPEAPGSGSLIALLDSHRFDGSEARTSQKDFDLTDIHTQLSENISRISEAQLSPQQQHRLKALGQIHVQLMENQASMDSYAQTYLYHFLLAISKLDRADSELPHLPFSAIAHASLSQTQEPLTHFILSHLELRNIKFNWRNARSLGIFLFTSDVEAVRVHLESVAKAEYNRNPDDRNPVDCSLYYLALGKKVVLQSLWRRTVGIKEKENTLKLLTRDFSEAKNKATALKNAYALLSKRRFEYAAAFFLLGGNLADAANVCVNQLHDVQLAIAITRAWSGDASESERVMKKLIAKDLVEAAIDSDEARWLGAWGCIHQRDMSGAIQYMVCPIDKLFESCFQNRREGESNAEKINTPFAALNYRANAPGLLIKMYTHLRSRMVEQQEWTRASAIGVNEKEFVMRCVKWYLRAGMDILALRLVTQWDFVEWQEPVQEERQTSVEISSEAPPEQPSALDAWLGPDDMEKKADSKANGQPQVKGKDENPKVKPPPTQFVEPSADSLLDSFGF